MDYALTAEEAASVVLSAIGMYAALMVVMWAGGRRMVAAVSSYDLAAGMSMGAVMGRTVLGDTPTLPAGVLGLATLTALHVGTRLLARRAAVDWLRGRGPLLLMRDGKVLAENLRRARLDEADLRVALRRSGVGSYAQVGVMVLERSGAISVVRSGQPYAEVLTDVEGRARLRA